MLNTDEAVGDLREHMHYVYSSIFVEYVTKNPLYEPGRPFKYAVVSMVACITVTYTSPSPAPD